MITKPQQCIRSTATPPESQSNFLLSTRRSSDDGITLSKSIGGDSRWMRTKMHRQVSDLSSIVHKGYLLKRSNNKVVTDNNHNYYNSSNLNHQQQQDYHTNIHQQQQLFHSVVDSHDYNATFYTAATPPLSSSSSADTLPQGRNQLPPTIAPSADFLSDIDQSPEPYASTLKPLQIVTPKETAQRIQVHQTQAQLSPPPTPHSKKTPVEHSIDLAAAFFGISPSPPTPTYEPICQDKYQNKNITYPTDVKVSPLNLKPKRTPSLPIKVKPSPSSSHIITDTMDYQYHSNNVSHPMLLPRSQSDQSPAFNDLPLDYTDPKDGHLWRAKYCVLQDGILYFYRNITDGDSIEAVAERKRASANQQSQDSSLDPSTTQQPLPKYDNLSASPRPRRHVHLDSVSSSTTSSEYNTIWEKRVHLTSVGAVRSSELEYGKYSFELVAPDVEDTEQADKLVLQARNLDEMKEWLWQFHTSLNHWVSNIVASVNTNTPSCDNFKTSSNFGQNKHLISKRQSEETKLILPAHLALATSPRHPTALSHGHGRNSLHRKRRGSFHLTASTSDNALCSLSSTPETTTGSTGSAQSPQLPFAFQNPSPAPIVNMDRILLPPRNEQQKQQQQSTPISLLRQAEQSTVNNDTQSNLSKSSQIISTAAKSDSGTLPESGLNKSKNDDVPTKKDDAQAKPKSKYIPPFLRRKMQQHQQKQESSKVDASAPFSKSNADTLIKKDTNSSVIKDRKVPLSTSTTEDKFEEKETQQDVLDTVGVQEGPFQRGGCADPQFVDGSITDEMYIKRVKSRMGPKPSKPFGCLGGAKHDMNNNDNKYFDFIPAQTHRWELGAVSECGVRNSNEDAYLVVSDMAQALKSLSEDDNDGSGDNDNDSGVYIASPSWDHELSQHPPAMFAVFDGHCGDHAARFATEKLPTFINEVARESFDQSPEAFGSPLSPLHIENILKASMMRLDNEFCNFCVQSGRNWESGTTALVTVMVDNHLVIANLGDCRGVICRSVEASAVDYDSDREWNELDVVVDDGGRRRSDPSLGEDFATRCYWKEVTDVHSPSREDERHRIENANGWITTEQEIPIGQLQRMDLCDSDVVEILKRCFCDRYESDNKKKNNAAPQRIIEISRVCGELAVSRAIGDRDFKAAFNPTSINTTNIDGDSNGNNKQSWDCSLFLPYPDHHNRRFQGDLVSNKPEFQTVQVGGPGVSDEFLLLACDGLWDVMDVDDAVRVARDLMFRKKWTAKRAAARLAEIAIHLGSSDNITVILVRFVNK